MTKIVGRTKENVASLPTWAQRRITSLEHEVARLKADADAASTPGATPVTLRDIGSQTERGLPPDAHVCFTLEEGRFPIDVSIRDGALEVYAREGYLTIFPRSSNVVEVKASHR